jgi:hypothetical protein
MPFLSTYLRLEALILAIAAPISSAPKLEGSSNWSPSRGWTTGSRASGEAARGPGLSWWFRLFHRPALPVAEGSAQQSGPGALMSRRPRSQSSARIRISRPAQRTTAESPCHVRPSLPSGDCAEYHRDHGAIRTRASIRRTTWWLSDRTVWFTDASYGVSATFQGGRAESESEPKRRLLGCAQWLAVRCRGRPPLAAWNGQTVRWEAPLHC